MYGFPGEVHKSNSGKSHNSGITHKYYYCCLKQLPSQWEKKQ